MSESNQTQVPADPQTVAELVEAWFVEHFHNSIVSRAGTEVYNHMHAAKLALQADFAKIEAGAQGLTVAGAVAAVEAWFKDHLQDSPISRVSQEIYDHARKATDTLKQRLADFL
jgi:hypothetical protein